MERQVIIVERDLNSLTAEMLVFFAIRAAYGVFFDDYAIFEDGVAMLTSEPCVEGSATCDFETQELERIIDEAISKAVSAVS